MITLHRVTFPTFTEGVIHFLAGEKSLKLYSFCRYFYLKQHINNVYRKYSTKSMIRIAYSSRSCAAVLN